jgi:DNA-directed RNA polymerase specialized sigma24 family protein
MDIKNLTEPQINEICKAFVYGRTIEDIAAVEELPVEDVKQLISDNAEKVQELRQFYKSMGVI